MNILPSSQNMPPNFILMNLGCNLQNNTKHYYTDSQKHFKNIISNSCYKYYNNYYMWSMGISDKIY